MNNVLYNKIFSATTAINLYMHAVCTPVKISQHLNQHCYTLKLFNTTWKVYCILTFTFLFLEYVFIGIIIIMITIIKAHMR